MAAQWFKKLYLILYIDQRKSITGANLNNNNNDDETVVSPVSAVTVINKVNLNIITVLISFGSFQKSSATIVVLFSFC